MQYYQYLQGAKHLAGVTHDMKLELLEKNFTYHIYNRGINSTCIFNSDDNKHYFLKLMDKYLSGCFSVYAYCLMDNHFHFLLRVNVEGNEATQKLSNFFNAYAKAFNKAHGRTGSLFEKHFKRIRIDSDEYMMKLITYIHMNPTHHFGIDFEKYNFSSYKALLSDKATKLEREETLDIFGGKDNFVYAHNEQFAQVTEKMQLE